MRHSLDKYNRLLTEQVGNNSYGMQILNTIQDCASDTMGYRPNGTYGILPPGSLCAYTPILKMCSHDTTGTQNVTGTSCRHYEHKALGTSSHSNWDYGGVGTSELYQIGDCFSWMNSTGIECIVGFSAVLAQTMHRQLKTCTDCGLDANTNNIPDCIDCDGQVFNGNIPGCLDCTTCSNYGGNLSPPVDMDDGSCLGCTDSTATNYNPNAQIDDGNCVYVGGCTDSTATNYDPAAITDDGSCEGCMDPWAQNHCGLCTIDDGSCTYMPILGCMDPLALNFNANATVDDGSCTYTPITTPVGVENPLTVLTHANPTIETKYCSCCEEGGGGFSISTPIPINDLCAQFNDPSNGISNCVETTKWNKEDCEERELPEKFSCDRKTGNCYPDPTGPFITMADCKKECRPDRGGDRWMCEGGNCYPNPNGQFTTQQDCEAKCGNDERLKEEINRIKELLH